MANAGLVPSGGVKKIRNVLLFLVDQHRQDCLGCYGNKVVRTPNIDRLAAGGIRFNNAFTPTAVCTPARTSLQTGLWAHRHGLKFNTGLHERCGGVSELAPDVTMFSRVLKDKGWRLAHLGKWHIGTEKNKPADYGYDGIWYPKYGYPAQHPDYVEFLNGKGVGEFKTQDPTTDPTGARLYSATQIGPADVSEPSYLAQKAIAAIADYAKTDAPFFISCNFWGPHAPYQITEKYRKMYKDRLDEIAVWPHFDCDLSDKPGVIKKYGEYWRTGWFDEKVLRELIAEYYGYITLIDEEIGRVVAALADAGRLDETLIVYTADHGSSVGAYRMWDKGFGMYDCITRIPFVVSHPALTPAASRAFVSLLDLAPTFLEIAGAGMEKPDGASLMPILDGREQAVREDFIVTEHFGHQVPFWQRMVRTADAKYVFNPMGVDEYYDLKADPWETRNVIGRADAQKLGVLKKRLLAWMEKEQDPALFWACNML